MKKLFLFVIPACIVFLFTGCYTLNVRLLNLSDSTPLVHTTLPANAQTVNSPLKVNSTAAGNTNSSTGAQSTAENTDTLQTNADESPAQANLRSPDSLSTEEILANMGKAINDMKNYKGTFTAVQSKKVTLNINKCSISSMTSVINGVVKRLVGEDKSATYSFSNGSAANEKGEQITATSEIPPRTKLFTLTGEGVVSAKAESSGDNTVYTAVVKAETTDFNNMIPQYHSLGMGYLDLAGMDVSPVKITKADMQYPGGTITVTTDKTGRIISLHDYLPMSGSGSGTLGILSADAEFNGCLDETWTFTW